MNEIVRGAVAHVIEGVVWVVAAVSFDAIHGFLGLGHAPGIGGFQGCIILYGLLKVFGGLWLMREWRDY